MTKQTHKKRKLCFFVNPISGRGKGEKIFNKAQKILQENNIEAVPYISQKKGDIKKSIINMDLMDYDAICVIGGDGTIHEAVNGLISSGKAHYLPLGVISGGSGNAFSNDLEIDNLSDAIERIIAFKISEIDVMRIMHKNKVNYSVNIIGWGMAAKINRIAEKLRFLGGIRYSIASLFCIMTLNTQPMKIDLDGLSIDCDGLLFLALNTVHTGKGMIMAPNAKLNDGFIDIILFRDASRWNILKIFFQVFSGNHIFDEKVEYKQVKQFSINTIDDALNIDGENKGITPIDVNVLDKRLKIFANLS